MHLSRLLISGFKNIANAQLEFSAGINVLYGDNGEGKTNLLDAIYYLSVCKSFLSIPDRNVVRHENREFTLFGKYDMGKGVTEKIACTVPLTGDKVFKRNGKRYPRLSLHVGLIPVVMVSPQDTSLVYGPGEERRRYMNFLLSQTEPDYLQNVLEYNKLLSQRNRLLKSNTLSLDVLKALDAALSSRADAIHARRSQLCRLLHPHVIRYYRLLSSDKEQIDLSYQSDLNSAPMKELLDKYVEKDKILQYTSVGIQRDDIRFSLGEHPLKICGSQGQQKTYLLALKLAQFSLIKQMKGLDPLLLLDDVFDKLDAQRVSRLLHMVVEDGFGQIFLTDSNKVRIEEIIQALGGPRKIFRVREGIFTHEKTED
ncbi:MAG: DNA replication and repair protein RecF [Bacteroidales bacterium]|nr:DNA replication and repair protein RecF [Bacteroidales bacterium]